MTPTAINQMRDEILANPEYLADKETAHTTVGLDDGTKIYLNLAGGIHIKNWADNKHLWLEQP